MTENVKFYGNVDSSSSDLPSLGLMQRENQWSLADVTGRDLQPSSI